MNNKWLGIVLGGLLLVSLACAGEYEKTPSATSAPVPRPAAPAPGKALLIRDEVAGSGTFVQTPERMVVRTINVGMLVNDIPQIISRIASLAETLGGFVVSSSVSGEEENMNGYITFRAPAENTDQATSQIRGMAVRVVNEQTNAQDVTEEYVDLQARQRTLEAAEAQLLTLLQRADKVEDILAVYRELTNVRSQIEQIKGHTQYLERTSSTSLISVSLSLAASNKPLAPRGWSALETTKTALRSLAAAGQGLANFIIWVGIFAPFWVPVVVVVLAIIWLIRRRKAILSKK